VLFDGKARCSSCHLGSIRSDINLGRRHLPSETGMDPAYAMRTAEKLYRTTPLRALWQHGPYFHDGSAPTLEAVVEHYRQRFLLPLSEGEQSDLVQFLKSI
jgi:cytochrome c peroxidase